MSDGVYITLVLPFKADAVDDFVASFPEQVKATKVRKGFRSLRLDRHKDDPAKLILSEEWDSIEDYHAYLAWRGEQGETIDALMAVLSGPPQMDFWDRSVVKI